MVPTSTKGEQKMMNITDADGKYKLTHGHITNLATGETKAVRNMPDASTIAHMDYNTYIRKCGIAFNSSEWPMTNWSSGRISY